MTTTNGSLKRLQPIELNSERNQLDLFSEEKLARIKSLRALLANTETKDIKWPS